MFRHVIRLQLLLFIGLVLLLGTSCNRYDRLVSLDQVAAEKWSNIEAQLQRRADLVPNLVSVVKGSAAHEQSTLSEVMNARARATSIQLSADDLSDPAKMAAFSKAQEDLHAGLGKLLAVQENYPDLKANQAFHDLQIQLEGTENRILRAREEYNVAAREYNAELLGIGGKVVNRVTGQPFKPRAYYAAPPESQVAPKVSF